jgi:phosphonate transport system permease protein
MSDQIVSFPHRSGLGAVLAAHSREEWISRLRFVGVGGVIVSAFGFAGIFELERYHDAPATIVTLLGDSLPPDFARWKHWGRPLLDTLAMSVSGTVLACFAALPLALAAARNTGCRWMGVIVRLFLNMLRSIPGVIWGVMFVAAVGFGPLPGVLALACHSTGMLGKLYAEILEHVDAAPGNALRSQGVSRLGVARFAVLPQILPRLLDITFYRWEHNVRSATVLGLVGAGGIGLEIMTAFHLFEYREALALVIVLWGLVTVINATGAHIRARLLDFDHG